MCSSRSGYSRAISGLFVVFSVGVTWSQVPGPPRPPAASGARFPAPCSAQRVTPASGGGLAVTEVLPGSPADRVGLEPAT